MADADEVADEEGHGGAAPPSRRTFLHGGLRVHQAPLFHDAMGEEGYLPVQKEEAGQVEATDEPELLVEALLHLRDIAPL